MVDSRFALEVSQEYSPELATELGSLRRHLGPNQTGDAVEEGLLRGIIDSSDSDLIVVRHDLQLVAASVISLMRDLRSVKSWLEGVVVHPDVRGSGAADQMADEWESWNRERGSKVMYFRSGWNRVPAHRLYLRRGARILNPNGESQGDETAVFMYPIPDAS